MGDMFRVTTPQPGYTGVSVGVQFIDGAGLTDNDAALRYFRSQGYGIEDPDPAPVPQQSAPNAGDVPKKSASTEAWRSWAVEHGGIGSDEAAELSRDQLVERFTSEETPS